MSKKLFLTNLQHFELSQFLSNAHIELSVYSFDTWQVCYRHIVDVHEGV